MLLVNNYGAAVKGKENLTMAKYVCSVCGFTYDEAEGHPDGGIAPGTYV